MLFKRVEWSGLRHLSTIYLLIDWQTHSQLLHTNGKRAQFNFVPFNSNDEFGAREQNMHEANYVMLSIKVQQMVIDRLQSHVSNLKKKKIVTSKHICTETQIFCNQKKSRGFHCLFGFAFFYVHFYSKLLNIFRFVSNCSCHLFVQYFSSDCRFFSQNVNNNHTNAFNWMSNITESGNMFNKFGSNLLAA